MSLQINSADYNMWLELFVILISNKFCTVLFWFCTVVLPICCGCQDILKASQNQANLGSFSQSKNIR